jgi:hypothetical protein
MEAGSVSDPSLRRTFKIIESFKSTTLTFNGAELKPMVTLFSTPLD